MLEQNQKWDGVPNIITGTTTLKPTNKVNHLKHGTGAATVTLPAPAECQHDDVILLYIHPTGTNTGLVTIATAKEGIIALYPLAFYAEGSVISFRCLYGLVWVPSSGIVLQQVNDGSMDATPGILGQVVYNLADSKAYVCTVAGTTVGTWSALN